MEAKLDIKDRNIFFSKEVNQASIEEVTKKIIEINEADALNVKVAQIYDLEYKPKPINIYIDSYGGNVYQCFGLLGIIENSQVPIHTIVTGCAMSCGFLILIHGHQRSAYKNSTPLYHQVSTGVWGTLQDCSDRIAEARRLQRKIEQMTLNKTNITRETLREVRYAKKNWFMSAQEALRLGVVDKIITR